jgi:hypothetical protein
MNLSARKTKHPIVRALAEYPFSIMLGGVEVQRLNTLRSLQSIGVDIDFLDYQNRSGEFDILHLFGNPPGMAAVVEASLFWLSRPKAFNDSRQSAMEDVDAINHGSAGQSGTKTPEHR